MQDFTKSDIDTLHRRVDANFMRIRKEKGVTHSIGLKSVGLISVAEIYHNKKTLQHRASL